MTAVQSLPNLPSLSGLGWSSSGSGRQNALGAEDNSRTGTSRKEFPRSEVSSSDSANPFPITNPTAKSEGQAAAIQKDSSAGSRLVRGFWSAQKTEAQPSVTAQGYNGRVPPEPPSQGAQAFTNSQPKIMQNPNHSLTNGVKTGQQPPVQETPALLILAPMNATFERKQINVPLFPEMLRIGRQTNVKTVPTSTNGYFDSKVLSRQHAEVWADRNGKIWIRDVKSSNGTFLNGIRLSLESRDSEPHELRENDMLELGIDIVSEDQKSIVHHKVSAKVEHAGIPTNAASVLDLNMADIEPGSGGGLSLPNNGMMRRLSNSSTASSNGRSGAFQNNGTQANGFGIQKHAGAWIRPISIEQVVKRLTSEARQAKQQSQDLYRTDDFVQALLDVKPGQEAPKAPTDLFQPSPVVNGVSPHKEHTSPFSQPPAPPPQLPLPDKPDAPPSLSPDGPTSGSFKRSELDKAMSVNGKSEAATNQILQLVEALSSAKKEIDSQDNRVRQLEEQLQQERKAREAAEERMRLFLENLHKPESDESDVDDTASVISQDTVHADESNGVGNGASPRDTEFVTASVSKLQERLNLMLQEMKDMKSQMDAYKQRAEVAEKEKSSLADMVERIRMKDAQAENRSRSLQRTKSKESTLWSSVNGVSRKQSSEPERLDHGVNSSGDKSVLQQKRLQDLATTAMSMHHNDRLLQSAPYASIVGVVLIGVGIMAYLNNWQKLETS